jgi:hypothetical protein
MGDMTGVEIDVSINDFASEEEQEAIQAAFDSVGIETQVERNYFMKSADLVPWIVSATVGGALGAFFRGFFEELGADAARRMQAWIRELRSAWDSSPARPGHVVFRGEGGNTVVIGDPPEEAYDKLLELDLDAKPGAYYVWDDESGEWKDGMTG